MSDVTPRLAAKPLRQSSMDYLRQTRRHGYNCAGNGVGKLGVAQSLVGTGHLSVGHSFGGTSYFFLTDLGHRAINAAESTNGADNGTR